MSILLWLGALLEDSCCEKRYRNGQIQYNTTRFQRVKMFVKPCEGSVGTGCVCGGDSFFFLRDTSSAGHGPIDDLHCPPIYLGFGLASAKLKDL